MKIIFSHGKESGPWGSKIKHLAEIAQSNSLAVESIDYRSFKTPDERVEYLLKQLKHETDDYILVGSSMGGYVSLVAAEIFRPKGLFLLAPALYMPDYQRQSYTTVINPTVIVHGWSDEVIPPDHSIRFAKRAQCSLHLIEGDHRLNHSIEMVSELFQQFLANLIHHRGK